MNDTGLLRPLTDRQREVVELLALGHDHPEIARQLGMSVARVEQHVAAVAALLPNPRRLPPSRLVLIWAIAQEFTRQGRAPQ